MPLSSYSKDYSVVCYWNNDVKGAMSWEIKFALTFWQMPWYLDLGDEEREEGLNWGNKPLLPKMNLRNVKSLRNNTEELHSFQDLLKLSPVGVYRVQAALWCPRLTGWTQSFPMFKHTGRSVSVYIREVDQL